MGLHKRLSCIAQKNHDDALLRIPSIIGLYDMINSGLPECAKLYTDLEGIRVIYSMDKFDSRFIWLEVERLFEIRGVDLDILYESRDKSEIYISTQYYFDKRNISLALIFNLTNACSPIIRQKVVDEVIGYTCH